MSETPINVTIRELKQLVEPTLVAAVSGSRSLHIVEQWLDSAEYQEVVPTPDEARRLEFALEQFKKVAGSIDDDRARAWFISQNVGGSTPYLAIRADNFAGVEASANAMINTWS